MPRHRLRERRTLCRVAAALVAAFALFQGLPFSPAPLLAPAGDSTCWFEPLDVCNAAGASLSRVAELPLLPPAAPEPVVRFRVGALAPIAEGQLPDGFPPPVYRPPRRRS